MKFSKKLFITAFAFGTLKASTIQEPVYEIPVIRKANNVSYYLFYFSGS